MYVYTCDLFNLNSQGYTSASPRQYYDYAIQNPDDIDKKDMY